jgi:hypothetical protein
MATRRSSTNRSAREARSDLAVSYNEFKEHEGQRYTGMKIGRSHKWYYDQGEWKEKKITPDWYILAHQNTAKETANDYTTSLTGLKFKIAHKRADTGKWSATPRTQRKRMIMFLRSVLADLEKQSDRDGVVIAARDAPAAGKRTARMSQAVTKRAKGRQRRASAHRPARAATRVRVRE